MLRRQKQNHEGRIIEDFDKMVVAADKQDNQRAG